MAGWADASRIQVRTREFARHGGQIHVRTRPLGRTVFFFDKMWELWVTMKSAVQIWRIVVIKPVSNFKSFVLQLFSSWLTPNSWPLYSLNQSGLRKERNMTLHRYPFYKTMFTLQSGPEWEIPAQHRQSWLDRCSDKLGLPAGRSGVISDKNAQNSKILSGQKRGISGNFGIKHLWGLSGVLPRPATGLESGDKNENSCQVHSFLIVGCHGVHKDPGKCP